MDSRVYALPGMTPADYALLEQVEAGLPITADISRADALLCVQLSRTEALVAFHALPHSISSLYRSDASGRIFKLDDHPLLFQALRSGFGGRRQREVISDGAPIIQDVYPIHNPAHSVIGAMVVETNMIAHERQRRRNRHFREAVVWLQEMCARGELSSAGSLNTHFGLYDGAYLVDHNRSVIYMSGITANLFRSIGITPEVREQPLTTLEAQDIALVEHVFATRRCEALRHETEDGRIWVRTALPLRVPSSRWRRSLLARPWEWRLAAGDSDPEDLNAVIVLVHNATEAVQKQRELNVKSAIIQEVHHRVKNNLQNIAAILRIQARRVENDEARQHLTDAVNRVLSMSVIHEFLSQDEHRPINIRDVCQRIAGQVKQVSGSPDQEIDIQVQGSNIRLPASQATPVAMVVNELLLNAVEHGLQGRVHGQITIRLEDLGDQVAISVEDDGHGLPPGFDPLQQTSSLGLHIVHTLVTDDLKGALTMESIQVAAAAAQPAPLPDAGAAKDGEPGGATVSEAAGTRARVLFPKRSLRAG